MIRIGNKVKIVNIYEPLLGIVGKVIDIYDNQEYKIQLDRNGIKKIMEYNEKSRYFRFRLDPWVNKRNLEKVEAKEIEIE